MELIVKTVVIEFTLPPKAMTSPLALLLFYFDIISLRIGAAIASSYSK